MRLVYNCNYLRKELTPFSCLTKFAIIFLQKILTMADNFRLLLLKHLESENRRCSDEDLKTVINIFGKYGKEYPKQLYDFEDQTEGISIGFYCTFIRENRHETEPVPFFKILEIDSNIGWVHPGHLEKTIFYYKSIKIIKDEKVS